MNRLALFATTAFVTFGASFCAFADDAHIDQIDEINGTAIQHQPGAYNGMGSNDSAAIVQQAGTGDTATQEQSRGFYAADVATSGTQSITQTNNTDAEAGQLDNGVGDTQTITQTGVTGSSATQTMAGMSGQGTVIDNFQSISGNTQQASQSGQTSSSIVQVIDGASSSGNTENAVQAVQGANNSISATILSGNGNNIFQTQDANTGSEKQSAFVGIGDNNYIEQYQGVGGSSSLQNAGVFGSDNRALQYQAGLVVGGDENLNQTGNANQAGQGQGNSANIAEIGQDGGTGNVAIQNQGLQPGDTGYMALSPAGLLGHR